MNFGVRCPSDEVRIILNAIEFGKTSTTLYLSYTNLNLLTNGSNYYVWCELNEKDSGFTIVDLDSGKDYYVTSSTLGVDKDHGTQIDLASTVKFKVYFPVIKDNVKQISIYGCGKDDGRWQFMDINLEKYKEKINVNFEDYNRDYALATLRNGEWNEAQEILTELIENNPNDMIALNTLGILSYVADNNSDAIYYFSEAIAKNPNSELAYVNRFAVYKYQKNYPPAIEDITKAIILNPDQPDNFVYRAILYIDMEDWKNAKEDLEKAIASKDFKKDAMIYYYRIYANAHLENWEEACKDIYIAYNLTNDKDLENELQGLWHKCGCK